MHPSSRHEKSLDSYFSASVNGESDRDDMRYEWLRLRSFSTFPLTSTSHSPVRLARSGFYYTGRNQECVCFSCGVHNSDWAGSSVTDIHTRLCSECRHLNGHDVTNIPIRSNNSSQSSHLLSESSKRKSSNKNAEQRVLENGNGSQNEQVSETVTVEELIDAILADKVTPPNPSEGNSQDIETNPQSPSLPADVDEPSRIYTANSTANADLSNEPKALSLKDETEVLLDENRRLKEQRLCRILPDASEKEDRANNSFSTFAQQTRGTVFLCFLCSPLAEGSSLDEGQHNQKAVSEIHLNTLETVSHCPNVSDYIKKASDKCAKVCGSYIQNGDCAYHCMRDSSKTSLVEFCAKPKVLFDFCPEYDPIGQRFQKDIFTLCNPSTPIQRHYNSSDIFFCDPGNCRQLKEAGVLRTDLTRLVTENTPINSGDMNDGWSSQHWILLLLLMAVFAFFVFLCIFLMRKHLSAWFQRMTKRRNRNDILDGEVFLDKMQK